MIRDLPAGHRARRAAGAAHARAARRAGGVATPRRCAPTPTRAGASSSSCATARDRANPSRLEQMQDLGPARRRSCPSGSRRRAACSTTSITCTPSTSTRCTRSGACTRSRAAITPTTFPVPTETIHEVTRPVALAVGTLLHDVGKPYGSPHSEIGAGLAVTICRRLGLDEEDIAAGRVPGAPAPGDGADVAAARPRRPGHDRRLRARCAATRRTCASSTC